MTWGWREEQGGSAVIFSRGSLVLWAFWVLVVWWGRKCAVH